MRKLLVVVVVFIVLLVGVAVFVVPPFAGPLLRDEILKQLQATGKGEFSLASVHVKSLWPVALELNEFSGKLREPALQFSIARTTAELRLTDWSFSRVSAGSLKLELVEPKITFTVPEASPTPPPQPHSAEASAPLPEPVRDLVLQLDLAMKRGTIHVTSGPRQITASDFSIAFRSSDILNILKSPTPVAVSLETKLVAKPWVTSNVPLTVNAPQLLISRESVKAEALQIEIAGLELDAAGETLINKNSHRWNLKVNMPALERLPVPPQFLPPGQWQGGFAGQIAIAKGGAAAPVISGQIKTQNLRGEIKLDAPPTRVAGSVAPEIELEFAYDKIPAIKKLNLRADLTPLAISHADLFSKPAGVPMAANAQIHGNDTQANIDFFNVSLGQLRASVTGTVGLKDGANSNIRVTVPAASLSGLEKMVRPLQASPLKGQVRLGANISGDIFTPAKLTINADDVQLTNVSGAVAYVSEDQSLRVQGPFAVNVAGAALIRNFVPARASMKGTVDLSAMEIFKKDVYQKRRGDPLNLNFDIVQAGNAANLRRLNVASRLLTANVTGKIENPEAPRLTLNLNIQKLSLADVSAQISELKQFGLGGTASGQVTLTGAVNFKTDFTRWPLSAGGQLNLNIPKIVLPKPPEQKKPSPQEQSSASGGLLDGQEKLPESAPLLPDWPVIRNSQLGLRAAVGEVSYGDLQVKGAELNAKYHRGQITGAAKVKNLFDGAIDMTGLTANGLLTKPQFSGKVAVKGLTLPKAIAAFLPEYKEYVDRGAFNGAFTVNTPMPATKNWLRLLTATGQVQIRGLRTKENVIEKVVGEKLAQFAKEKKALSPRPLVADVQTEFTLAKATANVKNFRLLTDDANEFQGAGQIGLNMVADLKGTLYLSKIDIGGDVRAANSDAQGRFVVPVEFKGPLNNPSFDVASSTLKAIAERTLKYSAKKATSELKSDLKDKVKDEAKKALKNLFKK